MFEKVSRSLKYDSIFLIYIIYGHQHRSLYPARLRVRIIKEGYKKVRWKFDKKTKELFEERF